MKSLRSQVFAQYDAFNEITHETLCHMFPNANIQVLRQYLSEARNYKRQINITNMKHVNLDAIEPLIIKALNKSPNSQNIKLALDFIRLKQSTEGLEDDIDIDQYLIKLKEGLTK